MSRPPEIHVLENETSLANEVADFLAWTVEETLRRHAQFRLVLSGGSTPRSLYRTLVRPEWSQRIAWPRIRFFFGDERCVSPTHAESNYATAKACLFDPLGIPDTQVARIHGEEPPEDAAQRYETAIRQDFTIDPTTVPQFDLVLLGLGDDGHTASLFPGTAALEEHTRLVVAGSSPTGVPQRVTMTYPLLNRARVVLFLVAGTKKAAMVRRVLDEDIRRPTLPAARIHLTEGRLLWYLDEAAAAALTVRRRSVPHHEE